MDTEVTQPPQPTQVTTQVTTVTKQKNPGRIQAGKKLVEWNRRNKQKIHENKDTEAQVKSTEEITGESKQESPVAISNTKSKPVYTVVGFVTGAGVVAYMLYRKWNSTKQRSTKQKPLLEKQTATQPEEKHTKSMPVRPSADPFCMQ